MSFIIFQSVSVFSYDVKIKDKFARTKITFISQSNITLLVLNLYIKTGLIIYPIKGELILDIGAGSGRDELWLVRQGYRVKAVEPVTEFFEKVKFYQYDLLYLWKVKI